VRQCLQIQPFARAGKPDRLFGRVDRLRVLGPVVQKAGVQRQQVRQEERALGILLAVHPLER
jgi:hypothetical protein